MESLIPMIINLLSGVGVLMAIVGMIKNIMK